MNIPTEKIKKLLLSTIADSTYKVDWLNGESFSITNGAWGIQFFPSNSFVIHEPVRLNHIHEHKELVQEIRDYYQKYLVKFKAKQVEEITNSNKEIENLIDQL